MSALRKSAATAVVARAWSLQKGEFARPINGDKKMEPAFGGLDRGNVDVEIADRIGFELLPGGFVAVNVGQAGDAVALLGAFGPIFKSAVDPRFFHFSTVLGLIP